jgi:hypothetical protein
MALSYLTDINLNKNELQNAVIQNLGSAPGTPVEGQIYYNSTSSDKEIYFWNGSDWISVAGDISEVVAGDGLTGGGNSGSVTLNVVGGTGITANANDIAITNTGVTAASYGSSTAIPVITVNAQGQITAASTAAISTDLTIAADSGSNDTVTLGTDTLTFAGTTNEIETTVTNNQIQIGLVNNPTISGNLIVSGNLTVSGTTTTVNTETINLADNIITLNSNETGTPSENAGIEVERGTSTNVALRWNETTDIWEITKDGSNYYEIQTVGESTYATSIGDGSNTSYTVTHNLGTQDVIVQLYDASSLDTVYADVVRTSTSVVTIDFAVAPTTNDIRVLVSKIG